RRPRPRRRPAGPATTGVKAEFRNGELQTGTRRRLDRNETGTSDSTASYPASLKLLQPYATPARSVKLPPKETPMRLFLAPLVLAPALLAAACSSMPESPAA